MLQMLPTQLVFGRDAILNIPFEVDWQQIQRRKQVLIKKDNESENVKQIPHTYNVGDMVLVTTGTCIFPIAPLKSVPNPSS